MADEEKQAVMMEMRQRWTENQGKIRNLESQRRTSEGTLRRAAITAAQLDELPEDVKTYRSVGKAYFLEPKPALMEHLEEAMRTTDADLKRITGARDALAKAQGDLHAELQELMKSMR